MKKETELKLKEISAKIGGTPVINMGEGLFGKLESENPAGSIKDRVAFYIIKRALEKGELTEDGIVVEATSGNTGIGLAYIAKELGIKCIIVMPDSMTQQRRDMIAKYGAELVLTPGIDGMGGAVKKAKEIVEKDGAFMANQFGNYSAVESHIYTTGPEIFSQVKNVKYIVAGVGSGSTAMGLKDYIVKNDIDCKVIGIEPLSSPLMTKGFAGPHKIQGIGANFIPDLVDVKKLDEIVTVSDEDSIKTTKLIYDRFGVKCGISSGAAFYAAMNLKKEKDGNIVVILPDGADRYSDELYQ